MEHRFSWQKKPHFSKCRRGISPKEKTCKELVNFVFRLHKTQVMFLSFTTAILTPGSLFLYNEANVQKKPSSTFGFAHPASNMISLPTQDSRN